MDLLQKQIADLKQQNKGLESASKNDSKNQKIIDKLTAESAALKNKMASHKANNDKLVANYKKSMDMLQKHVSDLKKENKDFTASVKGQQKKLKELADLKAKLAKADQAAKDADKKYNAQLKALQADLNKLKKQPSKEAKWAKSNQKLKDDLAAAKKASADAKKLSTQLNSAQKAEQKMIADGKRIKWRFLKQ